MNASYERDGFLLLRQALPDELLAPPQAVIERYVDRFANDLVAAGKARHAYPEQPFERRLAAVCTSADVSLRK